MNVVQGTVVRCTARFTKPNGDPLAVTDVIATIKSPSGTNLVRKLSEDTVTQSSDGAFYVDVTVDARGRWQYQFENEGPGAVVAKGSFTVSPRL